MLGVPATFDANAGAGRTGRDGELIPSTTWRSDINVGAGRYGLGWTGPPVSTASAPTAARQIEPPADVSATIKRQSMVAPHPSCSTMCRR